jgi:hypothetical protein
VHQRRRIRTHLLLLGLCGGWPGGWLAQQTLRHKTARLLFNSLSGAAPRQRGRRSGGSARSTEDPTMWQGVLCGLLAGAMWGMVFVAPVFLSAFTPLEMACGRYIAYGLIAASLMGTRLPPLRRLDRADIIAMVKHALAGNIVYYMLLALGVKLAGVAATSLIIGVLPISVTLMGHKDHGSVPLRQLMLPLLLVAAGIACINIDVFTHDVGNGMPLPPSCSACCAQPARWPAGPGIRSTTRAT